MWHCLREVVSYSSRDVDTISQFKTVLIECMHTVDMKRPNTSQSAADKLWSFRKLRNDHLDVSH